MVRTVAKAYKEVSILLQEYLSSAEMMKVPFLDSDNNPWHEIGSLPHGLSGLRAATFSPKQDPDKPWIKEKTLIVTGKS